MLATRARPQACSHWDQSALVGVMFARVKSLVEHRKQPRGGFSARSSPTTCDLPLGPISFGRRHVCQSERLVDHWTQSRGEYSARSSPTGIAPVVN